MKKLLLSLSAAGIVAFTPVLQAQIPRTLTVQGMLADSLSKPIVDGIHRITIRVYDTQFGGNPLYFEEFTTPVFKGLFNLTLGSTKQLPKSLGFDKQYFLGISYDGKQEMMRIPLSSVPYALIAESVADGAITGSKIADGAITSDKLSPDLVLSLKGGDKTLGNTFTPPAFVGGGNNNVASGSYSTIGAGLQNTASASYSAIIGGNLNSAGGVLSVVGGGYQNTASSQYTGILGGYSNSIASSSNASTITGGYDNTISSGAQYSFIGGGYANTSGAQYTTIGGGYSNLTSASYATIAGGRDNDASGNSAFIGGGLSNVSTGAYSTIGGGRDNFSSAQYSTIAGGYGNTASGENSAILGGLNNSVGSTGSIAIGNNIYINNNAAGAIVIGTGASTNQRLSSSIPNSLTVGFGSNVATFFVEKGTGNSSFGRVGIGNTNPSSLLDLNGAFTFRGMSSSPGVSPGNQGRIYFDQTLGRFRVSQNGGAYVDLLGEGGGGGGGGWQLTGNAGIVEGTNYLGPNNDVYLELRAGDGADGSTTRLLLNTNGSIQRTNDGNERGDEAIDLQTFRSANNQVASGLYSVLTGGQLNAVSGIGSVVSGGQQNSNEGILSFIGAGTNNDVRGAFNTIVGGGGNFVSFDAQISSILGGGDNEINGHEGGLIGGVIGGGDFNSVNSDYGFIGGGTEHIVDGIGGVIGGGGAIEDDGNGGFNYFGNRVNGNYSGILGGADNLTNSQYAFIGGGRGNTASGDHSVIGGGLSNTTEGLTSTISGGSGNRANGDNSTVSGGEQNYTFAAFSTIPGGRMMTLTSNAVSSFGYNGNSQGAVRDITIDTANTAVWNNVDFWLTNNDGTPRSLRFYALYDAIGAFPNGTQYVGFKAPDVIASSVTWTLPDADGTDGQFLKTDGSGVLSWATASNSGLTHFTESANTAVPNNGGVPVVQLLATNAATNVDIALTPKGTGALTGNVADNTSTGGNKRGTNAVDWQTIRGAASQVASGQYATIGGGNGNTSSNSFTTVSGGEQNVASGVQSTVSGGFFNLASGERATVSGGIINTASGDYSSILGGRGLTLSGIGSVGYLNNSGGLNDMTVINNGTAVLGNTDLWLANNDNTPRALLFYAQNNTTGTFPNGTNYVGFKAPNSVTTSVTYTLPPADGNDGDRLTTDGAGNLSWTAPSIPCGGIIMWTGDINNVPAGWALCDGTNGTPDLNDRFPRGTSNSGSVGTLGGQDNHIHTVDNHSHGITSLTATGSVDDGSISGSTDNTTTGISATATLDAGSDVTTSADNSNNTLSSNSTVNITDNGHGHGVSGNLSNPAVTITSVSGNTDISTGVGTNQVDNIPAFVYVGFIMRICAQ